MRCRLRSASPEAPSIMLLQEGLAVDEAARPVASHHRWRHSERWCGRGARNRAASHCYCWNNSPAGMLVYPNLYLSSYHSSGCPRGALRPRSFGIFARPQRAFSRGLIVLRREQRMLPKPATLNIATPQDGSQDARFQAHRRLQKSLIPKRSRQRCCA
jgi:hypothetical protein